MNIEFNDKDFITEEDEFGSINCDFLITDDDKIYGFSYLGNRHLSREYKDKQINANATKSRSVSYDITDKNVKIGPKGMKNVELLDNTQESIEDLLQNKLECNDLLCLAEALCTLYKMRKPKSMWKPDDVQEINNNVLDICTDLRNTLSITNNNNNNNNDVLTQNNPEISANTANSANSANNNNDMNTDNNNNNKKDDNRATDPTYRFCNDCGKHIKKSSFRKHEVGKHRDLLTISCIDPHCPSKFRTEQDRDRHCKYCHSVRDELSQFCPTCKVARNIEVKIKKRTINRDVVHRDGSTTRNALWKQYKIPSHIAVWWQVVCGTPSICNFQRKWITDTFEYK